MLTISGLLKREHFCSAPIPDHPLFLSVQKNISSRYRIFDKNLNLPCRSFGHNRDHNDQCLGPCQKIQSPHTTCRNLDKTYRVWGLPNKTPPLQAANYVLKSCIFNAKRSLFIQVIDLQRIDLNFRFFTKR